MSETQPFKFSVQRDPTLWPCMLCRVYQAEVWFADVLEHPDFALCRICLRRLRKTLKEAEKALPPLPKVARPKED